MELLLIRGDRLLNLNYNKIIKLTNRLIMKVHVYLEIVERQDLTQLSITK